MPNELFVNGAKPKTNFQWNGKDVKAVIFESNTGNKTVWEKPVPPPPSYATCGPIENYILPKGFTVAAAKGAVPESWNWNDFIGGSEEGIELGLTVGGAHPAVQDYCNMLRARGVDIDYGIGGGNTNVGGPGLSGLAASLLALVPIDELLALYRQKLMTSPDFQALCKGGFLG